MHIVQLPLGWTACHTLNPDECSDIVFKYKDENGNASVTTIPFSVLVAFMAEIRREKLIEQLESATPHEILSNW